MAVRNPAILRREVSLSREQVCASAVNRNLDLLELCLAGGGNNDAKDEDGLALIHYAACVGNVQLIRNLRERGADMNLLDDGAPPWKPIHYAIFHRQHEAEQVLRTLGAKVPLPILKRSVREGSTPRKSETWMEKSRRAFPAWREL